MKKAIVSYKRIFDANNEYDGKLVLQYVDQLKKLDEQTPALASFILITNTSKQSYEYISQDFEKTLGLDRDKMISDGLKYYLSHYHPKDLPILLKVFEDLMVFSMNELDLEQRKRVVYTWNYRIKNSDDDYKAMHVQQTPIYFDDNGRPIIGYSQNTVIGDGRPRPLIATCKILNDDNKFETIYYKNYIHEALQQMLTKREIDVIKLLSRGHSTKEIAHELNISNHTVGVHRKKILKKTELNSTAEIIAYCNRYRIF